MARWFPRTSSPCSGGSAAGAGLLCGGGSSGERAGGGQPRPVAAAVRRRPADPIAIVVVGRAAARGGGGDAGAVHVLGRGRVGARGPELRRGHPFQPGGANGVLCGRPPAERGNPGTGAHGDDHHRRAAGQGVPRIQHRRGRRVDAVEGECGAGHPARFVDLDGGRGERVADCVCERGQSTAGEGRRAAARDGDPQALGRAGCES